MALRTPAFNDAKTYGFEWLRFILETVPLQEGVIGPNDFKVTPAAGGGMRVDVGAGVALIRGDSGTPALGLSQGLFGIVNDASIPNAVTLPASDPANPRVDQITLRVRDSSDLGTGADDALLEYAAGTPSAGATLDNRAGAAALGADRIRLADVLVPAGSSAVAAGNVRDRRVWGRGSFGGIARNLNASGVNDYSLATATATRIDPTNLAARMECGGGEMTARLICDGYASAAAPATVDFSLFTDGAQTLTAGVHEVGFQAIGSIVPLVLEWRFTPSVGSHLFSPALAVLTAGATINLLARSNFPLWFTVEESLRLRTLNGTS